MANIGLISGIIFYALVLIYFFHTRKKWEVHGVLALYRTQFGIRFMDSLARRFPRTLRFLGYLGVIVGFIGMTLTFVMLLKSTYDLAFVEGAQSGFAPVLPGVAIPGLPTLSFWHWLIGIFFLAVVHEFAHGVLARVHKLEVKNSGFGFLGPILLAFVEPDEKKISKAKGKVQLSVYAAGPFSNFLFAALFLLISLFIMQPLFDHIFVPSGIEVNAFTSGYPAEQSGLSLPFVIYSVNGKQTLNTDEFLNATADIRPYESFVLNTNQGEFTIVTTEHPKDPSRGYIGIEGIRVKTEVQSGVSEFTQKSVQWFSLLFFWLFILNIGVGLFNLLPLGPVDGGRMFFVACTSIFKNEERAKKVWKGAMYLVLLLIFINLLPWLSKLLTFLTGFFLK